MSNVCYHIIIYLSYNKENPTSSEYVLALIFFKSSFLYHDIGRVAVDLEHKVVTSK